MSDQTVSNNIVTIGGRQFAASCLTLGIIRRNAGALKTVMAMRAMTVEERELPSEEEFDAIIKVVGAALSPVEPTSDPFSTFVDGLDFRSAIADLMRALQRVMELSGYEAKRAGDVASGESTSAAPST